MLQKIIRDDQWHKLEFMLPGSHGSSGRNANNRLFLDATLFLLNNKVHWCDLPSKYGNWSAVYMRFHRWHKYGVWLQLQEYCKDDVDLNKFLIEVVRLRDIQRLRKELRSSRELYRQKVNGNDGRFG